MQLMRRRQSKHEGREIRTPNLLIWSQTRCRCAIPPVLEVVASRQGGAKVHIPCFGGSSRSWRDSAQHAVGSFGRCQLFHSHFMLLAVFRGLSGGSWT